MGTIRLLSDVLASQVAAGEVIERPASVAKELVENSIDAGAKRITLEFQRGGVGLLRVTDDGCGMDRSDALLSLERHATSKLRTSEDLMTIGTLGFRGEALPSIASVSQFRLITRQRSSSDSTAAAPGTEIEVHGGKVMEVKDSGESYGTRMEVRDLFYNVPARRKFLKGEQTEAAHIIQQFQTLAVAHPEIAFTCLRDTQEVFRLAATDNLAVRLQDLYGASFLQRMTEVPLIEVDGVTVYGFFARPGEGRPDRSHQMLFVNGRMVRSNVLSQPLREACDGILAKGLHPQAVLFFECDLSTIDCNVHPAKREVRFQEPGKIKEAALRAARHVVGNFSQEMAASQSLKDVARSYTETPLASSSSWLSRQSSQSRVEELPGAWGGKQSSSFPVEEIDFLRNSTDTANCGVAPVLGASSMLYTLNSCAPSSPCTSSVSASLEGSLISPKAAVSFNEVKSQKFRYIGRLGQRYLLLEEDAGLVLLEIKAALERLTYDKLRKALTTRTTESQRLLIPEIIEVSPAEAAWIEAHQGLLAIAGLEVESFGAKKGGGASQSVKIDTLPALLSDVPVAILLHQLIDDLQKEESKSGHAGSKAGKGIVLMEEALAKSVSRMTAMAAKLPEGEAPARVLINDLLSSELPYATPSGRPTMIQLSEVELQRKFR